MMDDNCGLAERAYEPVNGDRPIETAIIEFAENHKGVREIMVYSSPGGMATTRYYLTLENPDKNFEEDLKKLRNRFPTNSIESKLEGESQEHLLMVRLWERGELSWIEKEIIEFASRRNQIVEVRRGVDPEVRDAVLSGQTLKNIGPSYYLILNVNPYEDMNLMDSLTQLTDKTNQDIICWAYRPDGDYQGFVGDPIWARQ